MVVVPWTCLGRGLRFVALGVAGADGRCFSGSPLTIAPSALTASLASHDRAVKSEMDEHVNLHKSMSLVTRSALLHQGQRDHECSASLPADAHLPLHIG